MASNKTPISVPSYFAVLRKDGKTGKKSTISDFSKIFSNFRYKKINFILSKEYQTVLIFLYTPLLIYLLLILSIFFIHYELFELL